MIKAIITTLVLLAIVVGLFMMGYTDGVREAHQQRGREEPPPQASIVAVDAGDSGLIVYRDRVTGCEYIRFSGSDRIVPRMNADAKIRCVATGDSE